MHTNFVYEARDYTFRLVSVVVLICIRAHHFLSRCDQNEKWGPGKYEFELKENGGKVYVTIS